MRSVMTLSLHSAFIFRILEPWFLYLISYIIFFSFPIFQVSSFAKWIKCTKQNADKNISYKKVERNCDEGELKNPFPPKCDHTELFFDAPKGCWLSITNVSYTYPWPYFFRFWVHILHNKEKVWSGKYRCVPKKNKQAPNSTRMAIFVKK